MIGRRLCCRVGLSVLRFIHRESERSAARKMITVLLVHRTFFSTINQLLLKARLIHVELELAVLTTELLSNRHMLLGLLSTNMFII